MLLDVNRRKSSDGIACTATSSRATTEAASSAVGAVYAPNLADQLFLVLAYGDEHIAAVRRGACRSSSDLFE